MLIVGKKIFHAKGSGRYDLHKGGVTDWRLEDGHTQREIQYMSPAVGDI